MGDPFVKNVLRTWKLEGLIDIFEKEDIDQHAFEALDDALIAQLITSIGKRASFLKHFKEYMLFNTGSDILIDTPAQSVVYVEPQRIGTPNTDLMDANSSFDEFDNRLPGTPDTVILSLEEQEGSTGSINLPNLVLPSINVKVDIPSKKHQDKQVGSLSTSNKSKVPYPAPLPKLSLFINEKINEGCLILHSDRFVRECGAFLMEMTRDPTPKDYSNYSQTIVEKYPEFKDNAPSPQTSMTKRLSHYIRNIKYREGKAKGEPLIKRQLAFYVKDKSSSSVEIASTSNDFDSPTKSVLKELREKAHTNSPHMKMLLKTSASTRRKWITTKASGTKEIMEKFPHLKNYNLFMTDFHLLGLKVKSEVEFATVVKKLCYYYKLDYEGLSNQATIELFQQLESTFHQKRARNHPPAICIEKVGSSCRPADVKCGECNAPAIQVYVGEGMISNVFLTAEGIEVTEIVDDVTPYKCIMLLLASYFLLDVSYPKGYTGILSFLEQELLGGTVKGNISFSKFMNVYNKIVVP